MNLTVFPDYSALSAAVADEIIRLLEAKPNAVICMASGSTPKGACSSLVEKINAGGLAFPEFFFVGLDEWVGLPPELPGSCRYDFKTRLFDPLGMPASRYHVFDGTAADLQQECEIMDRVIRDKGGIDLMIVGIGMNGHIGFNEPGVDTGLHAHVTDLHETTITVGQQKYFSEPVVLTKGITLGLATLMDAKKVILMASGGSKAEVIHKTLNGPVTNSFPASIIRQHPGGYVWVDADAASTLVN